METEVGSLTHLRWLMGQFLSLIALAAAFSLETGSSTLIMSLIALIAIGTTLPRLLFKVQGVLVGIVPKLLIVYILVDFLTSLGDVLPPLVRVMALLLSYRALEFRTPRQDRQLVLISLVLLLLTGTITTDLGFAFQLLLFVPLAMLNLAMSLADEEEVRLNNGLTPSWKFFSWVRWWHHLCRHLDRRLVFMGGAMYVIFALATVGLFWALPRFEFGHQLPFLKLAAGKSYTGFSETVNFGSVVDIQQDFSVALRVDGPASLAVKDAYWRMMVLDEYYGSGFRQSLSADRATRRLSDSVLMGTLDRGQAPGRELTCYFEGGISRQLPLLSSFGEVNFTARMDLQVNPTVRTFGLQEASANLLVYKIQKPDFSPLIGPTPGDRGLYAGTLAAGFSGFDDERAVYPWTTLEVRGTQGSHAFLTTIVEGLSAEVDGIEPAAFIEAATAWLQTGRGYSLQTRLGDGDEPVLDWMKGGEAGHCELYASGLILLARTAGIPARLVTGFRGGTWNAFESYLTVRNSNAHAWVEYFDPVVGWRRADPTPGLSLGGEMVANSGLELTDFGVPIDSTAAAFLDSLRVIWYRRIVNFDYQDQTEIVSGFRNWFDAAWLVASEFVSATLADLKAWFGQPFRFDRSLLRMLIPVVVGLALWFGLRELKGFTRLGTGVGHEKAVRRKAAEWLIWLRLTELPAEFEDVKRELLALRFAHVDEWSEPSAVFARCQRIRRQRKQRLRSKALDS